MAYEAAVLRRATERLEQQRKEREEAQDRRRRAIYKELPLRLTGSCGGPLWTSSAPP